MEYTKKASAYYGKQIMDINTDQEEAKFEENASKLTLKDAVKMLSLLPEVFLNLTFDDLMDMELNGENWAKYPEIMEAINEMTEEQINAFNEFEELFL